MKKRISIIIACLSLCFTGMAYAGQPAGNNVVSVTSVPGMDQSSDTVGNVFNKDNKAPHIVKDTRFTGAVIEQSIEVVRETLISMKNATEDMVYKKRNPIKGDLQNYDVGSQKDITDLMSQINTLLGTDEKLFTEKDTVAKSLIPIGNTGYKLPTDTEINVVGGSTIQAYPLKVDGEIIGHFRVVAGGYLTEDVLINNQAVSYCVVSMMTTGVSRTSDVHKNATTKLFFTGVSEPYIVGKHAKVKINWNSQPKTNVKGLVNFYNLQNVPHALTTLNYETTITLADGTRLSGTNALVEK